LKNRLLCIHWKSPIKFEFIGRDAPQKNYLAEFSLATIAARGSARMSAAKVPKELCCIFSQEAFQSLTYLYDLILTTMNGVTKAFFEDWENFSPIFVQCLRKWGESGIVKIQSSTTSKRFDRGKFACLLGLALIMPLTL
jgi:hypothetical protein